MADTEQPGEEEEFPEAPGGIGEEASGEEAAEGSDRGAEDEADGDQEQQGGQYDDAGSSDEQQQQQQESEAEDEGAEPGADGGDDEEQQEDEAAGSRSRAAYDGEQAQTGDYPRQRVRSASGTDGGYASERPSSVDSGTTSSRPLSAFRDLRGSRPNSAAIAAQIEGFDMDFMSTADDGHVLPDLPEHTEAGGGDDDGWEDEGPCLEEQLAVAEEVQMQLLATNESLQRRARAALEARNKGRPAMNKDLSRLDGAETRYKSALKQWHELLEEHDRLDSHYQATVFSMKAALEERIARADDVSAAFKHFKKEVARAAEHSKSGQPISAKALAKLESREAELDDEVQRMRLRHITLANALKRCEGNIHNKEQLAEGLHLIDFEQLKMENQSLNEKIEERNEELIKLRKKTTTTVQILTHMKEKLQYVEKENSSLESGLADLESSMIAQRDSLTQLKATRDALRTKGRTIKASSVYVTSPQLLADLEAQKERRDDLLAEAERLKEQHPSTTAKISKASSKIISASDDMRRGTHSSGASRMGTAPDASSRLNTAPRTASAATAGTGQVSRGSARLGTAPGSPSAGSKFSRGSVRTGTPAGAGGNAYHSGLTGSGIMTSSGLNDKW